MARRGKRHDNDIGFGSRIVYLRRESKVLTVRVEDVRDEGMWNMCT